MINYAIKTLRIDTTRMYVCGLSMGGGTTWDYSAWITVNVVAAQFLYVAHPHQLIEKHITAKDTVGFGLPQQLATPIVPSSYSVDYVQDINSYKPWIKAKLTPFQANVYMMRGQKQPTYHIVENGTNILRGCLLTKEALMFRV